ncbi:MarR family winged helix-turn-helix transcriptional regulator [Streptomyces echinatus]|uniref:DNA-binding MarR family transcriptional regulator n=1 Tax=Streptomyces echinatus TaxID=67293 RepID=A0A7W9Q2P4_9ACTN|nr:MarR family transcriptional regulator [Streptomyces echinatus]MBB5932513.1 DNA-binding MarR family transcriptional regulator [Streptomyces echinatus]
MSSSTPRPDRVDELLDTWHRELPAVLGPSSELAKRVMLLAAALDAATRRELTRYGLTGAEFDILAALRRAGKPYRMKPHEVGRAVLLSSGGTTNTLNRLAARGLVDRSPDPDDGRSMFIRLTPEGVELAERALLGNAAAHAEVFDGVPGEDLDAAAHALRAVPLPGDRGRRS